MPRNVISLSILGESHGLGFGYERTILQTKHHGFAGRAAFSFVPGMGFGGELIGFSGTRNFRVDAGLGMHALPRRGSNNVNANFAFARLGLRLQSAQNGGFIRLSAQGQHVLGGLPENTIYSNDPNVFPMTLRLDLGMTFDGPGYEPWEKRRRETIRNKPSRDRELLLGGGVGFSALVSLKDFSFWDGGVIWGCRHSYKVRGARIRPSVSGFLEKRIRSWWSFRQELGLGFSTIEYSVYQSCSYPYPNPSSSATYEVRHNSAFINSFTGLRFHSTGPFRFGIEVGFDMRGTLANWGQSELPLHAPNDWDGTPNYITNRLQRNFLLLPAFGLHAGLKRENKEFGLALRGNMALPTGSSYQLQKAGVPQVFSLSAHYGIYLARKTD